jgi:signal transduction histidine kinase
MVLVSLALVGACIFGLLYLNALHVEAYGVLSENEKSTRVALRLEIATRDLLHLLRANSDPDLADRVKLSYQNILQLRDDAQELANWDEEKNLVEQIDRGLAKFNQEREELLTGGQSKPILPGAWNHLGSILETNVLKPTIELQKFNTDQIKKSDQRNRAIVDTLKWGLIALGIGVPITGLLLGFAMARSMGRSIYQLSVGIRDAAGRLKRELGSVTLEEKGDLPDLHRQMQGVVVEIERVISELQQREREVLRAEQLAAVGQVAAGVAHELRNPLTSVKMLVQTGLEGSQGLPAEDLTIIENEIRRMEQCIRVLLDFARPPSPERRQVDLADLLRRSLTLIEGRARRQKVTVKLELPSEPIRVNVDPEQIHQVLINLLLNALDALPQGGTVQVVVDPRQRSVNGQDGSEPAASQNGSTGSFRSPVSDAGGGLPHSFIEVRIRDTGPGIVPRIRQRLFEPFVTNKETGLGLGLSICKRLIEDHGGAIRGDNCSQGGAEFAFTLPR